MTVKKIKLICELLTEQMNHWMLFPVALTAMGMNRGLTAVRKPNVLLWVLCGLIPLGFFALRAACDKRTKFWQLLLFHAGAAAGMALFLLFLLPFYPPAYANKMLCVLCPVLYMIYSLLLYVKRETLYSSAMQPLAAVIIALAASLFRQRANGWDAYYSVSLIFSLALFALVFYMQHYIDFLSVNKNSLGHLPVSEMFHSGMGLVIGYALFGIGILFFSTQFEWVSGVLKMLGELVLKFIHWLRSIWPKGSSDDLEEIPAEGLEIAGEPGFIEQNGTSWFWTLLEILFFTALIVMLLIAVYKLLRLLLHLLEAYMKKQVSMEPEEEVFDYREKCDTEKSARKKTGSFAIALTYREQVRKLYRRRILSSSAKKRQERRVMNARTAREWERELQTEGMAKVYEQARYSECEVTAADVKKMREVCKL